MSFYKLAKARTSELERPEKKIKIDYGDSKRVDIAKYHDDLTKGKVKQDYDSIRSHHHNKINHSDYLISQTNLGKTDLLKNKLLSERMAQLNATKYESVQEVDINLGIGSDNAVVQEVNQVIGDFIQKISSGVFDLTMTNDLYKLYKLIQTQTYKFGSDLLERYKSYFEDVKETLDLDETANVVRSYSRKDSSVLDLMTKIVENSIKIIDKMLDAIVKGKSSDERKQILEQDVKNITFKKIDRTYLKELSDEIKNLEKSKKSEKDARKNAKNQALLEQLKNIEKVARMPEMQKQSLLYEEEREMERQREQREREADENQEMEETRTEIARLPTGLEDLVEERTDDFLGDMERDLLEGAEPLPVPEPVPEPAPKPKKEETAKETPLFKSTEYTSTATKITLLNGTDYYRNREQFIDKQSKIELENLLKRLNINYSKWSSTTKGDNEVNVKAFRTKAWDVLKDNPRLKLKGGSHWFKK